MALQSLTIRRPDDWHVHLRDGEMLRKVAPYTARQFARAIIMPNLARPVTTVEAAAAYRDRIREAAGPRFEPLMTCYLTDRTNPGEIARGFDEKVWIAAKLYPAGATTNSASGVTDVRNIYPVLERMEANRVLHLASWQLEGGRAAWCGERLEPRNAILRELLESRAFALALALSRLARRGDPPITRERIRQTLEQ